MQRTHLRLIAGRPVSEPPVLREEYRAVRLAPAWKRWLEDVGAAIFSGLAILTLLWAFAAFMLSFGGPR